MSFTKVAPAGIGTSPGNSILIGDSLLHSTGIDIGSNTGIGVTIRKHGDATFTGIITASAFFGDGSGLEGVSSSGIGTALNDDDTNVLNKIYYVNQELSIGSTVTVNHPDTGTASYTHYQDLVVKNDADFIVADGDTFIPDILGITTSTLAASAATGGRIRAGTITNAGANGAVNFPNGLVATSATFTGVLTYEDVTNVDSIGIVTARGGIRIGGGTTVGPISGIVTYFGDGSQLTGISVDSTKIETGNTKIETVDTGSDGHIKITTEGSERLRITSAGKVGIGTDNPLRQLQILGDADTCVRLISSAGGVASYQLGDTTDHIKAGITFKSDDNSLRIRGHNNADRIIINSNGIVTKPSHPMLSMTVDSSLLSGNYMTHNSVLTNNGNHYNTSTSKFVCPVAGFYYASIMVMSNNSNTTMDLELHINGSNANNILVPYQASTGGQYNQVSGSCILQCAANAELQFKLNSGSIYGGRHSNITFALFA